MPTKSKAHRIQMMSFMMYFRSSLFSLLTIWASTGLVFASPKCPPSDPTGSNPGHLCLVYPTHGMSLESDSFRKGFASEGYYGTPVGPEWPGQLIQPNHTPRTPIEKTSTGGFFWTNIEASNGNSRVRTNSGREWELKTR